MANEYSHIPNNHLADALISKIKGVANSKSYAQITSASWSVSEEPGSTDQDPLPTMTINSGDSITFTGMEGAVIEFDTPSHANVVIPEGGEITVEGFGLDAGVTVTVVVQPPEEKYKPVTLTDVVPDQSSEDESSEGPTPSGGYGFEVTSATAIINQGTTTVTIEVSYDGDQSMVPYHINIFKDAEKTQSLVDKGGEGAYIHAELDYTANLSVGDTIYYD
jgi:hypothetical protein